MLQVEKRSHDIAKLGRVANVASEAAWQARENEDRAQRLRAGQVWHLARLGLLFGSRLVT